MYVPHRSPWFASVCALLLCGTADHRVWAGAWEAHVQPLLESRCLKCHGGAKKKGGLDLRSVGSILKGGEAGPAVVAGRPDESLLYELVQPGADPHMPPKGDPLTSNEIGLLRVWIESMADKAEPSANPQITEDSWTPPPGTSLSEAIDLRLSESWSEQGISPASGCDDATFVRRVTIDLAGRIPTVGERAAFLESSDPGKRSALVERLLSSREFAKHMSAVFDVVFLDREVKSERDERRSNKWLAYLEWAFDTNRPWDQVAADLVQARPASKAEAGASWFLAEKGDDHHAMATATARAFLGKQIQCAQCHDHPVAPEVEQKHYWGMVAFFNRSYRVSTPQGPRVGEAATGGYSEYKNLEGEAFESVLALLDGKTVKEERKEGPDDAENYLFPPPEDFLKPKSEAKDGKKKKKRKGTPSMERAPVPRESRRAELTHWLTKENPDFGAAAVNRVWAYLLGRGIVHPVDRMDSSHPASHPQLLTWMTGNFAEHGYDLRRIFRGIVLSRAYQLSSNHPAEVPLQPDRFAVWKPKPLSAEALYRSLLVATGREPDEKGGFPGVDDEEHYRRPVVTHFPVLFPEVVSPQVNQALFFSNSTLIDSLIIPDGENLASRMVAETDPNARTRLAFLHVLGREPTVDELARTVDFFASRTERTDEGVKQVLWALLAGAEFRFSR